MTTISSLPMMAQMPEVRAPQASKNAEDAWKAAKQFEATFISDFIQHLFNGVNETQGMFGGGQMEGMFRSVWSENIAKSIGNPGFGIAESIMPALLKAQENNHV